MVANTDPGALKDIPLARPPPPPSRKKIETQKNISCICASLRAQSSKRTDDLGWFKAYGSQTVPKKGLSLSEKSIEKQDSLRRRAKFWAEKRAQRMPRPSHISLK